MHIILFYFVFLYPWYKVSLIRLLYYEVLNFQGFSINYIKLINNRYLWYDDQVKTTKEIVLDLYFYWAYQYFYF